MEDEISILIVDDNLVNRIAAKSVLTDFQVSVLEAESGQEAIQRIKEENIDVIFMDILMPEMDGIETTKQIRSLDQGKMIKIIATSGTEIQNQEQYLHVNQFDGIILKPLKIPEILKCLSQWFDLANDPTRVAKGESLASDDHTLSQVFGTLTEISLKEGLKYAHNSRECYLHVMRTSLKQLNNTINSLQLYTNNQNYKQIYLQLHLIKSVFFYLGAQKLGEITKQYEAIFMQTDEKKSNYNTYEKSMQDFKIFIQRITTFRDELEQAIQAYDNSIRYERNETNVGNHSIDEINQLIETITLHVYRFEYVEIMNGLKSLEQIVNENSRSYVQEAISATEEFNYDKVKAMLVGCWNEINEK